MSKTDKLERLREAVQGKIKPATSMRIFVQPQPSAERRFYAAVPWPIDVNVNCPTEATANDLKEFLSAQT